MYTVYSYVKLYEHKFIPKFIFINSYSHIYSWRCVWNAFKTLFNFSKLVVNFPLYDRDKVIELYVFPKIWHVKKKRQINYDVLVKFSSKKWLWLFCVSFFKENLQFSLLLVFWCFTIFAWSNRFFLQLSLAKFRAGLVFEKMICIRLERFHRVVQTFLMMIVMIVQEMNFVVVVAVVVIFSFFGSFILIGHSQNKGKDW